MLEYIFIGSFCVMGIYAALGEEMILHQLKEFLERISDNRVLRPFRPALYECPICMASIWGTGFWLIMGMPVLWIIYVFGVAGLNYVLINLVDE